MDARDSVVELLTPYAIVWGVVISLMMIIAIQYFQRSRPSTRDRRDSSGGDSVSHHDSDSDGGSGDGDGGD